MPFPHLRGSGFVLPASPQSQITMSNLDPIDVSYEPIPQPHSNLIGFPQPSEQPSRQPSEQPSATGFYTSQQLADVAGVSRQSWGKDWFKAMTAIAPPRDLKQGRLYTDLTYELTASLRQYRDQGMSISDWVTQIALPRWGRTAPQWQQAAVDSAAHSGAIVPVEVRQASDASSQSLALASSTAGTAQALLDAVFSTLDNIGAEQRQTADAARIQRLIAEESLKMAEELKLRAKIRAELESRQAAKQDEVIRQQLEQFNGGAAL
ncbi:MAG: hypothetical protein HC771_22300 [Synechococcales cyanobacterium CRU_2_2]|nr:hypothetical protein [Synechococcales cyanobacterium CRU_2_2]